MDFIKSIGPKIREFYAVDDSPMRISSINVLPSMKENIDINSSKEDEKQCFKNLVRMMLGLGTRKAMVCQHLHLQKVAQTQELREDLDPKKISFLEWRE